MEPFDRLEKDNILRQTSEIAGVPSQPGTNLFDPFYERNLNTLDFFNSRPQTHRQTNTLPGFYQSLMKSKYPLLQAHAKDVQRLGNIPSLSLKTPYTDAKQPPINAQTPLRAFDWPIKKHHVTQQQRQQHQKRDQSNGAYVWVPTRGYVLAQGEAGLGDGKDGSRSNIMRYGR